MAALLLKHKEKEESCFSCFTQMGRASKVVAEIIFHILLFPISPLKETPLLPLLGKPTPPASSGKSQGAANSDVWRKGLVSPSHSFFCSKKNFLLST